MDPLGNVPVYLSVLNTVEPNKRFWIVLRESFIAFVVLCIFLFFGKHILSGLHITEAALSVAGGIILFLIAVKMILPPSPDSVRERQVDEPFIVPLAIPLVAGPSSLATVVLFSTQEPSKMSIWFIALLIASISCTIILLFGTYLKKILGEKGLIAIERLMGMILTTIAVQMFLSGISEYFKLN